MQKMKYTFLFWSFAFLYVGVLNAQTPPPSNDECFDAIPLECGQIVTGSTETANFDEGIPCEFEGGEGTSPMAPGVWYMFTGTGEEVTVSLCDSDYDAMVGIYTGNCDGLLDCVAANDDSPECGLQSLLSFETEIGVEYYIHVNGYEDVGDYVLELICGCNEEAPLNDGYAFADIGNGSGGGNAFANNCEGTVCVESYGFPLPNADKTFFAYKCLCGDGEFIAEVVSVSPAARGGIMFRENNSAGSRKATLKTQFTLSTLLWRDVRLSPNAMHYSKQMPIPGHTWLRLVRYGNYFLGYASQNGSHWYFTFFQYIPMSECIEVGLYVESPNVNTFSQACFANISTDAGTCDYGELAQHPTLDIPFDIQTLERGFEVYPNPVKDELNIRLYPDTQQKLQLIMTNNLGQVVRVKQVDNADQTIQINVADLTPGMYMVSLKVGEDEIQTKKVIVK